MTNFEKLVQAGLATEDFTADQKDEINDLSESTVDAIIATANPSSGLDGAGGQR